jgi:putative salt-induced outer membrane protein YdiY
MTVSPLRTLIVGAALLAAASPALAQDGEDERKLGWFLTTEFTAVWTGGNSESSTFGLGFTARRLWERSELRFDAGGTQTESTLKTRTAVGTLDDFEVREEKNTEKTAELFYARGRYDYNISQRVFAFGGADWLRNTFAGIDSRFLIAAGLGNTWADRDQIRFKTDYSATVTFQEDVVDNPFTNNSFPGVRLGYDLWWMLTGTTEFESVLIVDWNLDNTDDLRADFTNALPISISETLQFKPALQLLWRNDPSLTEVALVTPGGDPTGDTVLAPLEKLDTLFTVALVLKI